MLFKFFMVKKRLFQPIVSHCGQIGQAHIAAAIGIGPAAVGAAVAADGMGRADHRREALFKGLDFGAADVLPAAQHTQRGFIEFRPQVGELLTETEGRHLHGWHLKPVPRTTVALVRDAT